MNTGEWDPDLDDLLGVIRREMEIKETSEQNEDPESELDLDELLGLKPIDNEEPESEPNEEQEFFNELKHNDVVMGQEPDPEDEARKKEAKLNIGRTPEQQQSESHNVIPTVRPTTEPVPDKELALHQPQCNHLSPTVPVFVETSTQNMSIGQSPDIMIAQDHFRIPYSNLVAPKDDSLGDGCVNPNSTLCQTNPASDGTQSLSGVINSSSSTSSAYGGSQVKKQGSLKRKAAEDNDIQDNINKGKSSAKRKPPKYEWQETGDDEEEDRKIREAKKSHRVREEQKEKKKQFTQENKELTQKNKDLTQRNEDLTQKNKDLTQEKKALERKLNQKDEKIPELNKKEDHKSLNKDIESLNECNGSLLAQNDEMITEFSLKNKNPETLVGQKTEIMLRDEKTILMLKDENNALKDENNALKDKIDALKDKIDALKDKRIADLQFQLEQKDKNAEQKDTIADLKFQLEQKDKSNSDL